ncbi:MAG: DNA polymerase IV [Bacteroidota bacterium]
MIIMFNQAILHLDLDTFFVSVETLKDSGLRGRPVIITGHAGRGIVASCSYAARHYGVRPAMPIRMALRLCPQAIVRKGDLDTYIAYSNTITEIIATRAPLYEKSSIDDFYLDLTGMDRYFGSWQWAQELRMEIIRETGLPLSMSLATNKLVAKVGANVGKPGVERLVEPGQERAFFNPLSVDNLPAVGRKTVRKLAFMGVRKVETLAELPQRLLINEFGRTGRNLWHKANALDNSPVVPHNAQQYLLHEHTFAVDTIDVSLLYKWIDKLTRNLGFELRRRFRLTSQLTVKITYTDRDTHTRQRRISYTANDRRLVEITKQLFAAVFQRRQLVRSVGVKASRLVSGTPQVNLFDDTARDLHLTAALDNIREKYGDGAIEIAGHLDL